MGLGAGFNSRSATKLSAPLKARFKAHQAEEKQRKKEATEAEAGAGAAGKKRARP